MSCGVGHRCGSDLALLWLWCRPVAVAPIGPLAWEPPYAASVALKRKKKYKEVGWRIKTLRHFDLVFKTLLCQWVNSFVKNVQSWART